MQSFDNVAVQRGVTVLDFIVIRRTNNEFGSDSEPNSLFERNRYPGSQIENRYQQAGSCSSSQSGKVKEQVSQLVGKNDRNTIARS